MSNSGLENVKLKLEVMLTDDPIVKYGTCTEYIFRVLKMNIKITKID